MPIIKATQPAGVMSRLVGPVAITTSNATYGTVATGRSWRISQIILVNTNIGLDATISIGLNGAATTAASCIFSRLPIAGNDTMVLDTDLVLNSAETLQAIAPDRTGITMTVMGYLI